ncbi:MAG TPA: proprotein convertase P-domain-containing protein [Gaiellaceae bacterium]
MARGRRLLLLVLLSLAAAPGPAGGATKTYSTGPLAHPIPDVGSIDVPLTVLDKGPVSYVEVSVRIDHPRDSDLTLTLVSPAGTAVVLSAKRGGAGRNYGAGAPCGFGATVFGEGDGEAIQSARPPFTADIFLPEQPLSRLHGQEAAGTWKLRIADDTPGAAGRLRCFKLRLSRDVVSTRTAAAGSTVARLSFRETNYFYRALRLRIERHGKTLFDARPAEPRGCPCSIFPGDVAVRDLDRDGEPEVVADLYTGGPHCCFYSAVYRYLPGRRTYRATIGFWGNSIASVVDIGSDGRPEFRTRDDRFAYVFTSFAGSAFPIRIFRFDHGRFVDVTRRFPSLVRRDARSLFALYLGQRKTRDHVAGILAPWLADQYLLGRGAAGWKVLERAVRLGELTKWEEPRTYLRRVRAFLRRTGYITRGR